jgi:cell division protein FtsB
MRLLIALFAAALLALNLRLWLSDDGLREQWALEAALEEQSAENARLAERNAALEAEVRDLQQGVAAAEERARSELGMVRPDETFYQIVSFDDD